MGNESDLFMQLVLGLQSSCWMLLGKVANPVSGELYKNLDEANRTIEILMMLEKKTRGNLNEVEETTLSSVIQQLQVNYVDEVKKDKAEPKVDTSTTSTERNPKVDEKIEADQPDKKESKDFTVSPNEKSGEEKKN